MAHRTIIVDQKPEVGKNLRISEIPFGPFKAIPPCTVEGDLFLKTYSGVVSLSNPSFTWSGDPTFENVRLVEIVITVSEPKS